MLTSEEEKIPRSRVTASRAQVGFFGSRNFDFNDGGKSDGAHRKEDSTRNEGGEEGVAVEMRSDKFYETNFMRWRYAKV